MIGNKSAFTLVELIVVITIVGILSTVGFVSYSGYLTGARDSNRFSQLTKLSDSLQTYAASKSLPLPDDYIEITASGSESIIAYQGYVGVDVLETIDYTNGGKDPKDDSYFTYYLTKDRNSLQLLAFMENTLVQNRKQLYSSSYAIDYEERVLKTYGRNLGVLVSAEDTTYNSPAQEISSNLINGYLDVFHTSNAYTAIFGDRGQKTGSGEILGAHMLGGGDLLGYWGFNEGSGTIAIDGSGNGNNGIHGGTILPTYTTGIKGTALDFAGNPTNQFQGSKVVVESSFDLGGSPSFSYGFWIKSDVTPSTDDYSRLAVKSLSDEQNHFEFTWDTYGSVKAQERYRSCSKELETGRYGSQVQGSLPVSEWIHITCVYGPGYISTYVNGKLSEKVKSGDDLAKRSYNTSYFVFGGGFHDDRHGSYINAELDEIYIFKKDLSPAEVEILYQQSQ